MDGWMGAVSSPPRCLSLSFLLTLTLEAAETLAALAALDAALAEAGVWMERMRLDERRGCVEKKAPRTAPLSPLSTSDLLGRRGGLLGGVGLLGGRLLGGRLLREK